MSPAKKSLPMVPYVRQSKASEHSISLDEQLRAIKGWASSNNVDLLEAVEDKGVSGSKHWRDRGLGKAIDACEKGTAQGIIVAFQDRLSRENGLATAEVWEAMDRAGARLVAANEGLDTATGDHELLFAIKAAIAREQWKRFRKNWADTRSRLVREGVHVTARVPVGYDRIGKSPLAPNADAAAVRRLFEMRGSKPRSPWSACVAMMDEKGCQAATPTGLWSARALGLIVKNRVYLGEVRYGDEVNPEGHPAIVDPGTWRRAQVSDGIRGARKDVPALLHGMVFCAGCEKAMGSVSGGTKEGARYRYMCRNRHKLCPAPASCYEDELDALVEEAFLMVVPHHYAAAVPAVDVTAYEQALVEARAQESALQDRLLDLGTAIDPEKARERLKDARAAVVLAEDRLSAASAGTGLAREALTIQQRWSGLEKADKSRWLGLWGFRLDVSKSERWGHDVADRTMLTWSPTPLEPTTVEPATLRDLWEEFKASEAEAA